MNDPRDPTQDPVLSDPGQYEPVRQRRLFRREDGSFSPMVMLMGAFFLILLGYMMFNEPSTTPTNPSAVTDQSTTPSTPR